MAPGHPHRPCLAQREWPAMADAWGCACRPLGPVGLTGDGEQERGGLLMPQPRGPPWGVVSTQLSLLNRPLWPRWSARTCATSVAAGRWVRRHFLGTCCAEVEGPSGLEKARCQPGRCWMPGDQRTPGLQVPLSCPGRSHSPGRPSRGRGQAAHSLPVRPPPWGVALSPWFLEMEVEAGWSRAGLLQKLRGWGCPQVPPHPHPQASLVSGPRWAQCRWW